jgi:hypothetical protein
MSSERRFAVIGVGGVLAWYLFMLVFWAIQPFTDAVPVGVDYTLTAPHAISVKVQCNTLFRTDPRQGPLPTLKPQPDGKPTLVFAHEPCARRHREAQALFVLDTAVVVVCVSVAVWLSRRRSTAPQPGPVS